MAGNDGAEVRGAAPVSDRWARKLDSIAELSEADVAAIRALPLRVREFAADQDIVREGDRPAECALVMEGFVFRHKLVIDGRRQILSFDPPGDVPDLQSLHLTRMDHSIGTLVRTKIGFIAHRAIEQLAQSRPGVGAALWRETLIDAAIYREWMIGLGRRSAYQRVAHLLCEMALRLEAVGLGGRDGFQFPVTQAELADALGLSTVHANRVVQELRRAGIVAWRGPAVVILDWAGLREAGGFDAAYLHRRPGRS